MSPANILRTIAVRRRTRGMTAYDGAGQIIVLSVLTPVSNTVSKRRIMSLLSTGAVKNLETYTMVLL